jgi:hypothetical protein
MDLARTFEDCFRGMFVEVNFMAGRDVGAYAERQAASCLYLLREYRAWRAGLQGLSDRLSARCVELLSRLEEVHSRQFRDLGAPDVEPPGRSFYFDSMEERIGASWERLMTQAVSYERGRLRYVMLRDEPGPWRRFEEDAAANRDACVETLALSLWDGYVRMGLGAVVGAEAEVMAVIDARNGRKVARDG